MATVSTPHASSQSASVTRSGVKVPNLRTGSPSDPAAPPPRFPPCQYPGRPHWDARSSTLPRRRAGISCHDASAASTMTISWLIQTRSGPNSLVFQTGSAPSPNAATTHHIMPDQNHAQKRAVTHQSRHGLSLSGCQSHYRAASKFLFSSRPPERPRSLNCTTILQVRRNADLTHPKSYLQQIVASRNNLTRRWAVC